MVSVSSPQLNQPLEAGPPMVVCLRKALAEDLGDYVLTFKHACACRGACLIPDGVSSLPSMGGNSRV